MFCYWVLVRFSSKRQAHMACFIKDMFQFDVLLYYCICFHKKKKKKGKEATVLKLQRISSGRSIYIYTHILSEMKYTVKISNKLIEFFFNVSEWNSYLHLPKTLFNFLCAFIMHDNECILTPSFFSFPLPSSSLSLLLFLFMFIHIPACKEKIIWK